MWIGFDNSSEFEANSSIESVYLYNEDLLGKLFVYFASIHSFSIYYR
jgi:hypothetical protein